MGQAYKIDRLNLITYKGRKKKVVKSLRCRYMAKSKVVNCNAQSQSFEFVNFRGSHFKNVNFQNTVFYGCDFWGTTFNGCNFQNAKFQDCVFMASKLKDCNFTETEFAYSTIVNTNLSDRLDIDVSSGVILYSTYPKCDMTPELETALETLKNNRNLKKNKLLFISDTKYNQLNLFLLQRRYRNRLPVLLLELNNHSAAQITTYKKMERVLNKLSRPAIM